MCVVALHEGANGTRKLALDTGLARSYHEAMLHVAKGTERARRDHDRDNPAGARRDAFPGAQPRCRRSLAGGASERLAAALGELIKMREREGKHLAKDLIHRLKVLRKEIKEIRAVYPEVVKKYRTRVARANRKGRA